MAKTKTITHRPWKPRITQDTLIINLTVGELLTLLGMFHCRYALMRGEQPEVALASAKQLTAEFLAEYNRGRT